MPDADDAAATPDGDDHDDADDGLSGFRPPPHPDDRLWRHPSEMAQHPIRPIGPPAPAASDRGRSWGTVVAIAAVTTLVAGVAVALNLGEGSDDSDTAAPPRLDRTSTALPSYGVADGTMERWLAPRLVLLEGSANAGSGVLVDEDGIVLTSAVLLDDAGVKVRLANGETVEATVIGVDKVTGIGVLRLPGRGYSAARMAEAMELVPGRSAYLVGADTSGSANVTVGIIGVAQYFSGGRQVALEGIVEIEGEAAPLALGGPLVDDSGTVIGITTATNLGPGKSSSYIAPAEVTHKVMRDLLETGDVYHSWLGIRGLSVSGVPVDVAQAGGFDHGVLVASVVDGSPAEDAGLRADDVIVQVDDRLIAGMPDLYMALRARSPGDRVTLTLVRNESPTTLSVVLGTSPDM